MLIALVLLAMMPAAHAFQLEADSVSLPATGTTSQFTEVTFRQAYDAAPVVFLLATDEGPAPAALRVRNVTATGFEVSQVEPNNMDGPHLAMTVDYIAIDTGTHTLPDGTLLEAGTISTSTVQAGFPTTTGWESVGLTSAFGDTPAVVAQIQTMNNESGNPPATSSVPFLTTAIQDVATTGFDIALERSESSAGTVSSAETIAYLAIAGNVTGSFVDNDSNTIDYESVVTNRSIRGWEDGCFTTGFSNAYTAAPRVVATKNSHQGANGGWLRRCSLDANDVGLTVDEDVDADSERRHRPEAAGIVAFSDSFDVDFRAGPSEGLLDYRMDEFAWDGSSGEVTDASVNDLDGRSIGASAAGASPARPGNPGTCRYGTFGLGDYITGPNDAVINDASSVSVSMWLRMDPAAQSGGLQALLSYGGATGTAAGRFEVFRASDRLFFRVRLTNGDVLGVATSGNGVFDGNWHHMAASYDSGDRELRVYVDGALRNTRSFNGPSNLNATNGPLAVGARPGGDNGIVGDLDEVRIFESVLTASEVTDAYERTRACGGVDYFVLDHDGAAINCRPEQVTLRAEDAGGDAVPNYTLAVDLSTSTENGDWALVSGNGTLTGGGGDDGEATYTFDADDNGEVTLSLENAQAETLNITADDGAATDDDSEGDLTFRPYGLELSPDPIPDQVAGKSFTLELTAVGELPTDPGCNVIEEYDGDRELAFWFDYEDPGSGGVDVTIDGNAIESSEGAASEQTIAFSNGTATVTADYRDAGEIQLHARDDSGIGAPPAGSGDEIVAGGTNTFVVRPFGFDVEVPADPTSTGPTGTVMARAGEAFEGTVTAVVWQSADDSDDDGVPDAGADLSDNDATPNFGQEATPEAVVLTPTLAAPSVGDDGSLSNATFDSFSGGAQTRTDLRWNEVGYVHLVANLGDADYLASGADVTGRADTIGRFRADRFSLSGVSLTDRAALSCAGTSPFTYIGERFDSDLTLTALATTDVGSTTVTNYEGLYAHLDSEAELNVGAVDQDDTDRTATLEVDDASFSWTDGVGTIGLELRYPRAGLEGPYTPLRVGVAPEDTTDAVVLDTADRDLDVDADGTDDHGQTGSVTLRFGRLLVGNAAGSEAVAIDQPLRVEYHDGSTWRVNTDDDCTTLALARYVDLANDAGATAAGDGAIAVGGGTTEITGGDLMIMGGTAAATFSAPGAGNTGWVELTVDTDGDVPDYGYLRTDPDGNDVYNTDPRGRVTFGIYGGDPGWVHFRRAR